MGRKDNALGIIGTGMMGCEHIRNLAQIDAADVVAIADPHELLSGGNKGLFGPLQPHCYEHYDDLLAQDDVDAVVIATPNYTHHSVMAAVFQTDKHVLLEKPLATTTPPQRVGGPGSTPSGLGVGGP